MFYAGIDKKKNDFQVDQQTPQQSERKTPLCKTPDKLAKPPKVLKDAGAKAINYS